MRRLLTYAIVAVAAFALGRLCNPEKVTPGDVKVFTRIDTVKVVQPEIVVLRPLRQAIERLPLAADTADTVEVKVPVAQTVYETPDFKAYVSGYRPALDSIFVYGRRTEIVRPQLPRAKRFSVGIQAGYGFTPHGFQPYVGIGLSVKLIDC